MKPAPRHAAAMLSLPFGALLCLAPAALSAQTVRYAGTTPTVNFGNVNLCRNPTTDPGPCSETLTLPYRITEGGTLGTPKVMTQGSPNLDFRLASTTCEGNVNAGDTCDVKVLFAPKYAGSRPGGVLITDTTGKVLATTLIYGEADGPQIGFIPGTNSFLPNLFGFDEFLAADGAGDIFTAGEELPVGGTSLIILPQPAGFEEQYGGVAVDSAGDVFLPGISRSGGDSDYGVAELPAGNGPGFILPFSPLNEIFGIAVDLYGDVFVAPFGDAIYELTPGGQQLTFPLAPTPPDSVDLYFSPIAVDAAGNIFAGEGETIIKVSPTGVLTTVAGGLSCGTCGIALDNVGNLYIPSAKGNEVVEMPAGGGTPITVASVDDNFVGYMATDAGGDLFINLGLGGPSEGRVVKVERSKLSTLNFGSVPVGSSATLPITVQNTGNRPLTISPFFASPSYTIVSTTPEDCPAGIAPAATCTLQIQFAPPTVGAHTIKFTLSTNAVADTVTVLEGTGTN